MRARRSAAPSGLVGGPVGLLVVHGSQAVATLRHTSPPPRDRGITWYGSSVPARRTCSSVRPHSVNSGGRRGRRGLVGAAQRRRPEQREGSLMPARMAAARAARAPPASSSGSARWWARSISALPSTYSCTARCTGTVPIGGILADDQRHAHCRLSLTFPGSLGAAAPAPETGGLRPAVRGHICLSDLKWKPGDSNRQPTACKALLSVELRSRGKEV